MLGGLCERFCERFCENPCRRTLSSEPFTSRKKSKAPAHTGRTSKGNTRDVKIKRIGGVTMLKRGSTYYLYYREHGRTRKPRIDGNLGVARATAAKVAAALAEDRPSPVSFQRTSPTELVDQYLDFAETVQCLAWRILDRYRAALSHLSDFCNEAGLTKIDAVSVATVEDFVRWLRGQTRTRNGHRNGKRRQYKLTGMKFILGTCKTAFNWAYRRRITASKATWREPRAPTSSTVTIMARLGGWADGRTAHQRIPGRGTP